MKHMLSFLLCVLVSILPIQSILGVFAVNRLGFPLGILLWKEVIEVVIMAILVLDLVKKLKNTKLVHIVKKTWPVFAILTISLFVFFRSWNNISFLNILYGFRFEILWVIFLSIFYTWWKLADLQTLEYLKQRVVRCVYIGFIPVFIVSHLTLLLGQERVLGFFGFGASNSKLLADIPISQVVDGGGWNNLLRLSGTFTTPNHFAGYLLLILGFFLYRTINERAKVKKLIFGFATINILLFIGFSFSRFAWLALVSWMIFLGSYYLVKSKAAQNALFVMAFILPIFIGTVAINLPEEYLQKSLPSFISKPSSTTFHARRTFAALDVLSNNPKELWIGYGLGASGPAAKDQYTVVEQNPLYKENIKTALRYYLRPEEILIPENWFLQLVLNGGWVYALVYSTIVLLPLLRLSKCLFGDRDKFITFDIYLLLGMFSIVIGNLFLHLWENQTVAIFYALLVLFMYKPLSGSSKQTLTTG
jgi:hypothetical protein